MRAEQWPSECVAFLGVCDFCEDVKECHWCCEMKVLLKNSIVKWQNKNEKRTKYDESDAAR